MIFFYALLEVILKFWGVKSKILTKFNEIERLKLILFHLTKGVRPLFAPKHIF